MMPDIAMCSSKTCLLRTDCKRHSDSGTKPSYWQAYMKFNEKGSKCDGFFPKALAKVGKV